MKKIKDIEYLRVYLDSKASVLYDVPPKYRNEAGSAALEAYYAVLYYANEHSTLEGLIGDKDLKDLLSITEKHEEYYKVLNEIISMIQLDRRDKDEED